MRIFFITALCLTLNFCHFTQHLDDNTVARVGHLNISKDEFQKRYEFTPMFRKQIRKMEIPLKLEMLYTLIAEKLWALEAAANGLDTAEVIKFSAQMFEKMFVRDALYHKIIRDQVQISDEELREGWTRNSARLFVNFIFSEDEEEINNLYNLMKLGIPFDSILVERPEFDEQPDPIEIFYGQMADEVEDSLYNLQYGGFTSPILTPDGWYIFTLKNRVDLIFTTDEDIEEARRTVSKTIQARKEAELYKKFFRDFFKDKKVDVSAPLQKSLAVKLAKIFQDKKLRFGEGYSDLLQLTAEDITAMEEYFGADSLQIIYIKFEDAPLTLKEFIRIIAFDGFNTKDVSSMGILGLLDQVTRQTIERELLAREGYRLSLDMNPEVQNSLNMWLDNYLFQYMQSSFRDSVTVEEHELREYYERNYKGKDFPVLVDIIEILTDSLEIMEMLMHKIEAGVPIEELAPVYTKREWTKDRGGKFGLFSVLQHGALGRIAGTLNAGDIYGPVILSEGYSIFKLIEKHEEKFIPPQPFDKVKDQILNEIIYAKTRIRMINYTIRLANKYSIQFNTDLLVSIPVTSINSFGFRHLGFGGRITAVPLLAPNIEWVFPWQEGREIIP